MKWIKVFYAIIFCLFLIPRFSIAQEKDQIKKATIVEYDSLSTISGTLVCIAEELAKIRKIDPECKKYGCVFGLKTPNNTIWSFHRNPVGIKLRESGQFRGNKIQVWGKLFHNAKVIEVHDFKILKNEK